MQETPPHTLMEIKLLLSQYLDGALDLEQVRQVEALLSTFPQYAEVLDRLQATRDAVRATLVNQEQAVSLNTESLWASIAQRLEADQETPIQTYDFEFVSAYYDGEILPTDAQRVSFESQLFNNDAANTQLAQVGELSQAVREWSARLETHCTVDVTAAVMKQFCPEETSSPSGWSADSEESLPVEDMTAVEMLSAYGDQALSPREVIEANRLIESDASAKLTLTRFNRISAGLESISAQIQAQAPDLTADIMKTLSQSSPEEATLVSLDTVRKSRSRIYRWAQWGGLTAASVLLVTFLSSVNWQDETPASTLAFKTPSVAASVVSDVPDALTPASSEKTAQPRAMELASVPASSRSARPAEAFSLRAEPADSTDSMDTRAAVAPIRPMKASPRRVERIIDGFRGNRVASRAFSRPDIAPEESRTGSPSSEDYLFNALNEQMSGEDVSSILGK
ncbi:anti-sigma factor family protein [Vampirovibrio chlorellavorus]|uniref:anti-sigma factor family protein n=1 Tax=Vampirovibrio chlorellavorus TaxID=758823 RepID=UPI0026F33921|nr:hypothetical protein [Vampirovibrio chlorellavorus]